MPMLIALNIFYNYQKSVHYKSSNLDILAENFKKWMSFAVVYITQSLKSLI